MASIVVEHLTKRYPSGTLALDDVNLDIADGEFVAVVGPSGCGKSTLLRIMAGLDGATEGRVVIAGGRRVRTSCPARPCSKRRRCFRGCASTTTSPSRSTRSPCRATRSTRACATCSALVGLAEYARAWPHELSGGMKQRAAVARAFVTDPPVLFMDEPFGALDEQTRVGLANELMRLWERSPKTVVFVTHGIEEAVTLADRVVVLSARPGRVKEIVPIAVSAPARRGRDSRRAALRRARRAHLGPAAVTAATAGSAIFAPLSLDPRAGRSL